MLNTLSSVSVRESRIKYLYDPQWFRDTASRGPTTIAAPESQFRTCPTDHDSIGYPRMSASGESSTTMHRLLHATGSHPIPPPNDPKTNQYNQDLGLIHSTNGNHLESPNEGSPIDHQLRPVPRGNRHFTVGGGRLRQSGPRPEERLLRQPALEGLTRSARTDSPRQVGRNKFRRGGGGVRFEERWAALLMLGTCVTLNGSGIQLAVGPQPLWLRNHNSGLAHRIMYGPFNPYIPIRSTTIGKSRVAIDPIAMHTSWRSNSDIASVTSIGYPRMSASGESSTTMHRLLHASGLTQSRRLMTPNTSLELGRPYPHFDSPID
ncbi:hypothetical protein F511_26987 [Dorcoceras hygrometricum]|uniref:Uncharacterized protein n=1 Tax=Dorcoceras hygrometricum TaxID=472368 RepID=A0A2Z7ABI4_9LAMI|nr:hypothetical protein F511_26987 [Dorcoceras hygrometricum]